MLTTHPEHQPEFRSATRYYLATLRRRWWLVAGLLILPIAASIAASLAQTPEFAGESQVVLSRQNVAAAVTGTPDPSSYNSDYVRIIETAATIARSPEVAERVIDRVDEAPMTVSEFLFRSSVVPRREADILSFTYRDPDPMLAARLSTLYAEEFVAYRTELDTAALVAARRSVDERLASLERQAEGDGRLATTLTEKRELLDTLTTLRTSNLAVIRQASAAQTVQVTPQWRRNIALALVAGAIMSILGITLLEALDTRVRTESEIATRLGVPLLARISPAPADVNGTVMLERPSVSGAEGYRLLRVALEFSQLGREIKVLMVTSARQGDGKSTVSANLAVALARAGRDVVLVDMDLRRPTINARFDLSRLSGMTTAALGHEDLQNVLQEVELSEAGAGATPDGRLRVLTSGPLPPAPGEFVGSASVAELLSEIRGLADVVILDTPPVLAVGDALSVSPMVDGVLLCVRWEYAKRGALDDLGRTLAAISAPTLGFVLNGKKAAGGYGYGYGDEPDAGNPDELTSGERS